MCIINNSLPIVPIKTHLSRLSTIRYTLSDRNQSMLIHNPLTFIRSLKIQNKYHRFSTMTPSELVTSTRAAFNKGTTKCIKHRLKNLKGFKKFLEENREDIILTMEEDLRKEREEARLEIFISLSHVKYLIDNVKSWVKPERYPKRWVDILDGVYVYQDPYGVILLMGAWNVPLLTLIPVAGAIAAGNCVIMKPSHNCPKFGQFLEKVLPKYLDASCYPVFLGDIEATNLLLEQRFDYIYYTGSVNVGRIVHRAANKYLTPVTLELGGKNPAYIDPTSDITLAARRIIWGKCFNSGQICIAPDYILCTEEVEAKFLVEAKKVIKEFFNDNPKCCPIINQLHYERIKNLLTGLQIVIGGKWDDLTHHIEPTIATDVSPEHAIMQEEIFGPVLPIIRIKNHQEAIEFICAREKPLALYIFGKNSSVRDDIIKNTSSGAVTVNDTIMHLLVESLPFGGVGLSGMGAYKGKISFDTFVHKKSVLIKNDFKLFEKINELRYPPYSARKSDVSEFLLRYRTGLPCFWIVYVLMFVVGFVFSWLLLNKL